MLYGFVNTPSVFFQEYLHCFILVYIDDIFVYSRNKSEHRQQVQLKLAKLREHQLYLQAEKCSFHQSSTQFPGYIISADSIKMNKRKVEAIKSWSVPSTIKELQRFLRFANFYRHLIKNKSLLH